MNVAPGQGRERHHRVAMAELFVTLQQILPPLMTSSATVINNFIVTFNMHVDLVHRSPNCTLFTPTIEPIMSWYVVTIEPA